MKNTTITKAWLKEQNACPSGMKRFISVYGDNADLKYIIEKEIKDYSFTYANWVIVRKMTKEQEKEYAIFAVNKAVEIVLKSNCFKSESWIIWAKKWLSGEDRSAYAAAYAANNVAYAAYAAAYAANNVAYAVYAAAYAANNVAYAAYAADEKKKLQIEILRNGLKILGY